MAHLTLLVLALQGPLSSWVLRAEDGIRVVVDTNVKCEFPVTPPTPYIVPVGMPIRIIQEVKDGGDTSYVGYPAFAPNSACKVPAAETAVFHKAEPDALVLTILDHILARADVTFDEFVAVENYLLDSDPKWKSEAGRKQVSGLLRFRWLQLLSRALKTEGFNSPTPGGFSPPLVESWRINHGDLLEIFGPSGDWYVPITHLWKVFESNKTAPWAEELVWYVANLPVQHDECEDVCVLAGYIEQRVLQYWTHFPTGPHIVEALTHASQQIQGVASGDCESKDDEIKLVAEIRRSLSKVTNPAKRAILNSLAEIEHKCAK